MDIEHKQPNPEMVDLLDEIDRFLSDTGMGPSYFGKEAVKNSEIVGRLRNGGQCLPTTAAKIRKFIKDKTAQDPDCADGTVG